MLEVDGTAVVRSTRTVTIAVGQVVKLLFAL